MNSYATPTPVRLVFSGNTPMTYNNGQAFTEILLLSTNNNDLEMSTGNYLHNRPVVTHPDVWTVDFNFTQMVPYTYSFYLYGSTATVTSDPNFYVPYAGFSDLITITVQCGAETITISPSTYYLRGVERVIGGTVTINLFEQFTWTTNNDDNCPVTHFELYKNYASKEKVEDDPDSRATFFNKADPATVHMNYKADEPITDDVYYLEGINEGNIF